jgi:Ala-tRNA(Pro) deacylase
MKEEIRRLLNEWDIGYSWVDHAPVFTVAQSLAAVADDVPIKNLLLKGKSGQYYLLVASGAKKVDMKRCAALLHEGRLRFADAAELQRLLGVAPGSVSVFGLLHDTGNEVTLLIDEPLLQAPALGFHPNDNSATIFVNPTAVRHIAVKLSHTIQPIAVPYV